MAGIQSRVEEFGVMKLDVPSFGQSEIRPHSVSGVLNGTPELGKTRSLGDCF